MFDTPEHCTASPFRCCGFSICSRWLRLLLLFCSGARTTSLTRFQVCRLPDSCPPLSDHSESGCCQKEEHLLRYSTRKSEHFYVGVTSPICAVCRLVLAAADSEECQRRRLWGSGEQNLRGQRGGTAFPKLQQVICFVPVYWRMNLYRIYSFRYRMEPTRSGGRGTSGIEETTFSEEA